MKFLVTISLAVLLIVTNTSRADDLGKETVIGSLKTFKDVIHKRAERPLQMMGVKGGVYLLSMGSNTGLLRKAGADAQNFADAIRSLIPKTVNIKLYRDAHVKDFRSGMNWLQSQATPNDTVIIYYSGHGSTLRDQDGDELPDHFDEVFVMADARDTRAPGESHVIRDDEFASRVKGLRTDNLIVVLDACFSAGLTKRGVRLQGAKQKFLSAGDLGQYTAYRRKNHLGSDYRAINKGVLIYAAEENQSAYEGMKGGAMTNQLLSEMLNQSNVGKSLFSLVNKASSTVNRQTQIKPSMLGDVAMLKQLRLVTRR